jgi:hypothetical protein
VAGPYIHATAREQRRRTDPDICRIKVIVSLDDFYFPPRTAQTDGIIFYDTGYPSSILKLQAENLCGTYFTRVLDKILASLVWGIIGHLFDLFLG